MSKSIAIFAALVSAAFVAGCGQPAEDEVVFVETPVVAEPVYNKY